MRMLQHPPFYLFFLLILLLRIQLSFAAISGEEDDGAVAAGPCFCICRDDGTPGLEVVMAAALVLEAAPPLGVVGADLDGAFLPPSGAVGAIDVVGVATVEDGGPAEFDGWG
ncbi:hypothetical protein M378DRAFT_181262 [Amanita muscaria Koide BX008]|uniref:Secreted protein n=1 Tax=Amanita muscaria (strain Koide BX008) TaxID=946122 RepID=A0A0C2WQF2_AMAMK|nr:hypothetical protein M378DRAFT_181262 [Amanita muscaria Koide BX008]